MPYRGRGKEGTSFPRERSLSTLRLNYPNFLPHSFTISTVNPVVRRRRIPSSFPKARYDEIPVPAGEPTRGRVMAYSAMVGYEISSVQPYGGR